MSKDINNNLQKFIKLVSLLLDKDPYEFIKVLKEVLIMAFGKDNAGEFS